MEIEQIEISGPGKSPAGHMPVLNFWRVKVVLQSHRMEEWEVVLPLAEVLDALKTIRISDFDIQIDHPAFAKEETG